MDPNELLRVTPEVGKIAAIIVGGFPAGEIVKSILVPPAAVLGKRMADRVDRLFGKTERMLRDAEIAPHPVVDKLWIDIVRGAAVEDNEDLHTMWAALLANAASAEYSEMVRPGFVALLKQLGADEATILNALYQDSNLAVADENDFRKDGLDLGALVEVVPAGIGRETTNSKESFRKQFHARRKIQVTLAGLIAQALISRSYWRDEGNGIFTEVGYTRDGMDVPDTYRLSIRGQSFIQVCQPPKPKENG
jgi:Abortive infection alpha